eukprot:527429-Prymnesium_polylepis.1
MTLAFQSSPFLSPGPTRHHHAGLGGDGGGFGVKLGGGSGGGGGGSGGGGGRGPIVRVVDCILRPSPLTSMLYRPWLYEP